MWISVKDRLPNNDGVYLCCDNEMNLPYLATFANSKFIYCYNGELSDFTKYITHWMTIPPKPNISTP